MANSEHLKILHQGTEPWNRWRRKHRAEQPDLSRADLQEINLRAANLNGANLTYANLAGANLGRAYLESAELHGATPRGAHLFDADLGHADLRENDLREAALWHARLEGANLRDARLGAADLRFADLTDADLRGCDLADANLTNTHLLHADLRGASLRGANLEGARLWGSRLEEADLGAARMSHTALSNVDLSRTRGLAAVRHESASSIGTDTLDLTAGGLRRAGDTPRAGEIETFLRYAGVQERYLELFRAALAAAEVYSVFIRHSLADRAFARRLHGALQDRGIRCWLNEHPMLPGDDFAEGFDPRFHPADKLLLCCSQAALTSWWLAGELERAAATERQIGDLLGVETAALVAISLDGYLGSGRWKSGHQPLVAERLAADFAGWEEDETLFERQLERLASVL